ncbi:LysR family transcriptional regulator [Streptomyces sp. NPDC006691]|uniref:LysR family transcriptional regulator n=1 Tax=Streptomyces sp. NPDC006691 TaxID=3364757 RepID=UPI00369FDAFC
MTLVRISARVPGLAALDLFLSVIELGSLGRAAQAHGISQPSASSRIDYLEKQVGVSVLRRAAQGSKPTPAGMLIAHWALDVINAAQRLDAGITTLRDQCESRLRVAASQTIVEYLFPQWLVELRTQAPGIAVALHTCNSFQAGAAVMEDRAHLGFIESPHVPEGLQSQDVARDRLLVVVAPDHPWARRSEIGVEELANAALIQREKGSGTRCSFENAMAECLPGWQASPLLELSSTTAIKKAAAGGIAPAVLSSLAVDMELKAGTLVMAPVCDLDMRRSLKAVWPVGQTLTGFARDLCAIASRPRPAAGAQPDSRSRTQGHGG